MIHIYLVVFAILFFGAISSFLGWWGFDKILTNLETRYPNYYAGEGPDFAVAFVRYLPLFVLFGVLILVMVESQKPRMAEQ